MAFERGEVGPVRLGSSIFLLAAVAALLLIGVASFAGLRPCSGDADARGEAPVPGLSGICRNASTQTEVRVVLVEPRVEVGTRMRIEGIDGGYLPPGTFAFREGESRLVLPDEHADARWGWIVHVRGHGGDGGLEPGLYVSNGAPRLLVERAVAPDATRQVLLLQAQRVGFTIEGHGADACDVRTAEGVVRGRWSTGASELEFRADAAASATCPEGIVRIHDGGAWTLMADASSQVARYSGPALP